MFTNPKYLRNLKKHRYFIFLSNKIIFDIVFIKSFKFSEELKIKNQDSFLYILNNQLNKKYNKKISLPLNESFDSLAKPNFKLYPNNDKFNDLLKSFKIVDQYNYNFWANFFCNIFRYSYLMRFFSELIIIIIIFIYLFKKGTFY